MAFSFENYERNENFINMGIQMPNVKKTGTTICAVIFKDGVLLGSDTRATIGSLISEKNTLKIHYLSDNIYACGAGTSADIDKVTEMIASQLELHRLLVGKPAPVVTATRMIRQHLHQYQGHIGAALIVCGLDESGSYVLPIHPHGSINKVHYSAMGSGCLAALSVLERGWRPEIELEHAIKLVRDAINAGIMNDLGSGNNINLCIVTKDGVQHLKKYETPEFKIKKEKLYLFKPKSTAIISRTVIPIKNENTTVRQLDVEPMEVL